MKELLSSEKDKTRMMMANIMTICQDYERDKIKYAKFEYLILKLLKMEGYQKTEAGKGQE